MLFSILVLSIPNRIDRMAALLKRLHEQTQKFPEVEVLCLYDNKKSSIGVKREALVQMAKGKYLAFADDDDDVTPEYVEKIVEAARDETADVIVFNVDCQINGGNHFTVRYGMEYEIEAAKWDGKKWHDIRRKPFHTCVWRSEIAKSEHFADVSYCEDWHWLKRLHPKVKTQKRIDSVLTLYRYDSKVSESADSVNFRTSLED